MKSVNELDTDIDNYYKVKGEMLTVYLTPREIWEIRNCFDVGSVYYNRFEQLHQNNTAGFYYRGAKIVRKEL